MPELLPADTTTDVWLRFGRVPAAGSVTATNNDRNWPVIAVHDEGILFYWQKIGAFFVKNGKEVVIEPEPTVDEGLLRLVLTGPVLGALLHQRGFHVFHASVIADKDKREAIAFSARKRQGKSTLAAAMCTHGYQLMSDDIMALVEVNGQLLVQPGYPHTKLSVESAEIMEYDRHELLELCPQFAKLGLSVEENFAAHPAALRMVCILEDGDEPHMLPIQGKEALQALLPHWYGALFRGQLVDVFGREKHFQQCARLVERVPVCRLTRPKSFEKLADTVTMIDRWIKT